MQTITSHVDAVISSIEFAEMEDMTVMTVNFTDHPMIKHAVPEKGKEARDRCLMFLGVYIGGQVQC